MTIENPVYLSFTPEEWQQYRSDMPMSLSEAELAELRGQNDPIDLQEVKDVYLPISRLLKLYVEASQALYHVTEQFLGHDQPRVPFIIGLAGSVAVGKSTTARVLQTLISNWQSKPTVGLITTDGFLYPNAVLEERGLMARKGFPESYDTRELLRVLADLKSGVSGMKIPKYSHQFYDILPDEFVSIEQADIIIVEGLNVLQVGPQKADSTSRMFVSDYFDFSLYLTADIGVVEDWYVERFMTFRAMCVDHPEYYMHQFIALSDDQAQVVARQIWREINAVNYAENIAPYQFRSHLILQKAADHTIEQIHLRKI